MTEPAQVLIAAAELAREGKPFVMATVIDTKGRTPRDAGARMIWRPGQPLIGTIGGGRMEHLVIEAAEGHFFKRSTGIEKLVLSQDADQCCGGSMDVFIEFCGPRERVVIFGAGHVSIALAKLLVDSPLEVVIVDNRPEWNTEARFPGCRRLQSFAEGVAAAAERPSETMACVMTYSHDEDFDILKSILSAPALPAYVGLIGSRSKRACFFGRLSGAGIPQDTIETVRCPMGLGDMGKEPSQVAISIAGQLLLEAKALAAR